MLRLAKFAVQSLAALSLCLSGPIAAKPKTVARSAPAATAALPAGVARPALWKLSDADTTIYLFGTIHALPKGIEWLTGPVDTALKGSQVLVTEIPETPPATLQSIVMKTALLPEGQNLRKLLGPVGGKKLESALGDAGLPIEAFDQFEPWYAAVAMATLPLVKAGYSSEDGVEMQLAKRSKALGHPQIGLETAEYQLGLFDKLPQKTQLRYLREVMASMPTMTKELDELVKYWKLGNPTKLAALMNADEDDPQLITVLLTNRNRNWANWIKARMAKPGTVFIAVGAGHLAGANSVQTMLVKRGFKVVRVQ